jgi:N-formylglutamate deformylase
MDDTFRLHRGTTPLLVSIPHCGVHLPGPIDKRLTPEARRLADTDWHLERLYDFAQAMGASVIAATHSRYVIDLNRPPDGAALYPGADNTELCPTTSFAREPLYQPGDAPNPDEIEQRIEVYWRPYHEALSGEIERLRSLHGVALLYDAHSIQSIVPRFFDGRLTDFNLGTAAGDSAEGALAQRLLAVCQAADGFSCVLNGRFTGGYITRRYGKPASDVHAVQLELSQATYMDEEPPFPYRSDLADGVQPVLKRLLAEMLDWLETAKSR